MTCTLPQGAPLMVTSHAKGKIERADTCSHKVARTELKDLGYTPQQCAILERIRAELHSRGL